MIYVLLIFNILVQIQNKLWTSREANVHQILEMHKLFSKIIEDQEAVFKAQYNLVFKIIAERKQKEKGQ